MVLTNYDNNSFWQNDDINLPTSSAVTPTTMQQHQFNENFLLRQQKINYFNNCSGSGQITPSSSSPPINTTNNMIPDRPVSLISSNGYYGFAHCINNTVVNNSDNIVDDKFKSIAATTSLTVNNLPETNLQQVMMMPTNEMSFYHTKNGNFADKRKFDDNFGNYPGEMKRSRIEIEDNEMQTDTDMDIPNSDGDSYQQHQDQPMHHPENIKNHVLSTTNINQNSMNDHDANDDDVQFNNDHIIANKYSHSAHSINCRCRSSPPAQRSLQLENLNRQRSNSEHNLDKLEILFWHTHGALLHQQVNESYI